MTPSPRPATGPRHGAPGGFVEWLAGLDDDALVRLCVLRPDVAAPPPASVEVLASRLRSPSSTARALDGLDTGRLLVLATAATPGAEHEPVAVRDLARRLGVGVRDRLLAEAVGHLRERALLVGPDTALRIPAATAAAATRSPVVVPLPDEPTGAALERAWSSLSEQAAGVLDAIARGRVPSGALGEASSGPVRAAATELAAAGLAHVGGAGGGAGSGATGGEGAHVVPTAHALDRARTGPRPKGSSLLAAPAWAGSDTTQEATDASAGVAALDLLHRCDTLLDALSGQPLATLRSGGVGVRELRRVARATGLDEHELPLLLEVLAAAGLLASGDAEVGEVVHEDVWAPTDAADVWSTRHADRRWAELVLAWWSTAWRPWRVGGPADGTEGGGTVPVFSDPPGPPGARAERARVLSALAAVGPDRSPDPALATEVLRRHSPWWIARVGPEPGAATIAEARRMGLVVGLAVTSAARLLAGAALATSMVDDLDSAEPAEGADAPDLPERLTAVLADALPETVSEVIVQADLTVLAPGPLEPELAAEFALLAEVESAGAATTYRVTERSLRRALDAGRTAAGIRDLLARTSVTPVPQTLDYLVEDVARRHGRLRVGAAQSFVRCDDEALVAQVLGSDAAERCAVRRIAPTVLVAQARPMDLLDALRESGFSPVVEDTAGGVVTLARRVARVTPGPAPRQRRVPVRRASVAELRAAVAAMRSADRAQAARSGTGVRRTGEAAVAYLHDSAETGRPLAVSVVDPDGRAATRLVVPVSVGGGRVEGVDPETSEPVVLPLHRVIAVADAG